MANEPPQPGLLRFACTASKGSESPVHLESRTTRARSDHRRVFFESGGFCASSSTSCPCILRRTCLPRSIRCSIVACFSCPWIRRRYGAICMQSQPAVHSSYGRGCGGPAKAFLQPFKRPCKGFYKDEKAFIRLFYGLSKAFESPFPGLFRFL